jgi:hypothetical protein
MITTILLTSLCVCTIFFLFIAFAFGSSTGGYLNTWEPNGCGCLGFIVCLLTFLFVFGMCIGKYFP